MTKIAFTFAGQGAQYSGMGQELCNNFPKAKEVFGILSECFGQDMFELCFNSAESDLAQTINAQKAIFAHSLAAFQVLKSEGVLPKAMAGFSLGECTAIAAAEVVSFNDAALIIKERAQAMQNASLCQNDAGTMAAVIGMDIAAIEAILENIAGIIMPVNYNCPGQTVIAGETKAVNEAVAKIALAGGKTTMLKVSAAFHTPLMAEPAQVFKAKIADIAWQKPSIPIYSNVTTEPMLWDGDLAGYLATQINHPVHWQKLIENMLAAGYDTFIELGPGKALSGFLKRIDRSAKSIQVADSAGIAQVLAL